MAINYDDVRNFVNSSNLEIQNKFESALGEMGLRAAVPGVYDLNRVFVIILENEKKNARMFLDKYSRYPN